MCYVLASQNIVCFLIEKINSFVSSVVLYCFAFSEARGLLLPCLLHKRSRNI